LFWVLKQAGTGNQALPGFAYPKEAASAPFRAAAVARDGKNKGNGSNEGGSIYN
jgi:hypothetical protein